MRVYQITEDEMAELLNDLTVEKLQANNICDPYRQPHLTEQQIKDLRPFVDSIHRGFHMVAYNWATRMGFTEMFRKLRH